MSSLKLKDISYARSGDKGDSANVGVVFLNKELYRWALTYLTPNRIKKYMGGIVKGDVIRYELANINALNFILKDCLGGGGSISMLNDAQGKTLAQAILMMDVEVPDTIDITTND